MGITSTYSRKAEISLQYQAYIDSAPRSPKEQLQQAASNDGPTISHWRDIWLKNVQANKDKFVSFRAHSVGKLWGEFVYKPVILVGSGPSLKTNGHKLKNRDGIPMLSCLHNFHFLEDNDCAPDYYVSLDAGDVTVEEVSEGGSKTADEYWAITKNRKLICFIGTSPLLLEKWQGEVYFFNAPLPDTDVSGAIDKIEDFHVYIGSGGNVLGACLYLAKGIFGASSVIFLGADFSFSYENKFHGWDSKYDAKMGYCLRVPDVFGVKVSTWASYYNFKGWFEYVAEVCNGIYINCTEGGCLGAHPEGNIRAIIQMSLDECFKMFHAHNYLKPQCENPSVKDGILLF